VGADDRADDVEGVAHVRHPVADRLVGGVLEGARAARDGAHLGAEEAHAHDVELLPPDVLLAHVHDALEPEQGGGGGGGDAVLAGAGLGDHAALAHAAREQRLADRVVDLVGARVVEVLALEVDPAPPSGVGQALGQREQARPADDVAQDAVELGWKAGSARAPR
jgi:hypothetical protein